MMAGMELKSGMVSLQDVNDGKRDLFMVLLCEFTFISSLPTTIGFGYVGQNPWLQRGTIRENIIWGSVYDENRYNKVLFACALNDDIAALGGDEIGVGEYAVPRYQL